MNFAPAKVTHTTKIAKALPSRLRRSEWRRLQFGEFAESINERVEPTDAAEEIYVGLDDLDPGSLHIRRWGTGSDVIGTKLRFRKGEIIFGRRRAYQRKLALADVDGICSAHAMVVRANPQVVLAEFFAVPDDERQVYEPCRGDFCRFALAHHQLDDAQV